MSYRIKLENHLIGETARIWETLCEIRPALVRFDPPKIKLNASIWRCAGWAFQETRITEIGLKFFLYKKEFHATMMGVILPHELIHQADFDLYGDSEKSCGHGVQWQKLMVEYGLPANKYHSLEIPANFSIKQFKL